MSTRSNPLRLNPNLAGTFRTGNRTGTFSVLVVVLSVVAGVVATISPTAALVAAAAGVGVALLTIPKTLLRLHLGLLGFIVLGYAIVGKGFAYLGFAPLYLGELTLALGTLAALVLPRCRNLHRLGWMAGGFMAFGALRTIPHVGTYGIDAIRDGALWYYATFAIILCILLPDDWVGRVVTTVAWILPFALTWFLLSFSFESFVSRNSPLTPGSDVHLLLIKPSDRGIVLGSIAAFLLVGLYQPAFQRRTWRLVAIWGLWLGCFAWVATGTRGGTLALLAAAATAFLLSSNSREWIKPAVLLLIVAIPIVLTNPALDTGRGRSLSVSQISNNLTSLVSPEASRGNLAGTRDYRLEWWSAIFDYTVRGQYFLTGKGFGINLADDDGFQILADSSLRAPHNSHLTVLARMGVPGFLYWFALHLSFAVAMIRSISHSKRAGQSHDARVKTWIVATWLAMMIATSFDPYLEGPQGAIPFWCTFGLGMIMMVRSPGTATVPVNHTVR
jgi:hypothetical protein